MVLAAQRDRWRLWAPVAFGGGCGAYFALDREPLLWPLLVLLGAASLAWGVARHRGWRRAVTVPLMLVFCFSAGLTVAKLRSDSVAAPIAPALSEPVRIEGWVLDVDSPGARGPRIIVAPVRIAGLAPEDTPVRLRVTVRGEAPRPGEAIRVHALLNPPPGPAAPGAYDYGRAAWFQSLGGLAIALGPVRQAELAPAPWRLRLDMGINRVRYDLAHRLVDRLGTRVGGVAAAMTTGHESWIEQSTYDTMRDSGLIHILSISGLHMAIVGGFAFFAARFGVAAWPWLALRVPGKKLAALVGMAAVSAYLVMSGAPPPAERAAITAFIAFMAILLDRPAVSMNALGVAAFAVLLLQPEAVVMPGFQMSFAATAALVALAESWPRRVREIHVPLAIRLPQRAAAWTGLAMLASLVAGLATGPFTIHHFNRTAVYALPANMASSPIADFLMMPALALGALLEPLGLGAPFLAVAGWGIEAILWIGAWISTLPGAVVFRASAPAVALPIAFIGILFICLWRGHVRWLGLPLACAVLLWPRPQPPDLWIAEGGVNAAIVHGAEAEFIRTSGAFARMVWSMRRGLEPVMRNRAAWRCGRVHCTPLEEGPSTPEGSSSQGGLSRPALRLALWWGRATPDQDRLAEMCTRAEVISLRVEVMRLPAECDGRLVLDGRDFARGGSVELWRTPRGWQALWSSDLRGRRPWNRLGDPDIAAQAD